MADSSFTGETKTKLLAGEKELHEYDGIVELDNPMPRWWILLFYFGIVFGAFYYMHYELGNGTSIQQEFNVAKATLDSQVAASTGQGPDKSAILRAVSNPESLQKGRAVFMAKCSACHGAQGQGGIGPNLTDSYWLYGSSELQIAQVISKGVLEKGMPAWGAVLSQDELVNVVAYVKSIRGSNPPQAKAPQGTKE